MGEGVVLLGGEALFASGPCAVRVGGAAWRHAAQATVDGAGERLADQGLAGRRLHQRGTLTGESVAEVESQVARIEQRLDGASRVLVDGLGRRWEQVVMLEVDRGRLERVGPRWKVDYEVTYAVVGVEQ